MLAQTAPELGARIRERRVARGLTQEQLAGRAGVSRQWLVRLESGHPGAELGRVLWVLRALDAGIAVQDRPADTPGELDLDELFRDER